jgi:hypothetical protein
MLANSVGQLEEWPSGLARLAALATPAAELRDCDAPGSSGALEADLARLAELQINTAADDDDEEPVSPQGRVPYAVRTSERERERKANARTLT